MLVMINLSACFVFIKKPDGLNATELVSMGMLLAFLWDPGNRLLNRYRSAVSLVAYADGEGRLSLLRHSALRFAQVAAGKFVTYRWVQVAATVWIKREYGFVMGL
jgi:hypothetical protein